MTEKYLSERELGKKEKTYDRIASGFMWAAVLGISLGIVGVTKQTYHTITTTPPKIVQTYEEAEQTLNKLRQVRRGYESKLNFPYETPKVKKALEDLYETDYKKMQSLDEAILDVEDNRDKIKKTPEFDEYDKTVRRTKRITENFTFGGLFGGMTSVLGSLLAIAVSSKYRKKLKLKRLEDKRELPL